MNKVINVISYYDSESNLQIFFSVTTLISFVFFWIAIVALLIIDSNLKDLKDEFKFIALSFLVASFVLFLFYSLMPSLSSGKEIIKATIATALADSNLSQSERDYLRSLAASYSSGKERDTTGNTH